MVTEGRTPSVGVLLHWARTRSDRRLENLRRESLPLSALSDVRLMEIEEDVLYVVAPG